MTIRRCAMTLRLDTSHFTGQRPWSDQHLRRAVANGSSWADVLRILGVNNNGEAMIRVKGHAVRLGIDLSHLAAPPQVPLAADLSSSPPRRELLRYVATSIAAAWFGLRGFPTAVPSEPQEYDLLVTLPEGIRRVQVKSSTRRTANGGWMVQVGRRPYSLDKSAGRAPYDPDTLDYFFLVDGAGGLYLVPSGVVAGRVEIATTAYSRYRVGDVSSLLSS